jgi:hypothetical protein
MSSNDRSEIDWAPRVSLALIRKLYESEARGDADDELINEVGYALLARCQSILEFTEACEGRVMCKRCAKDGVTTYIDRKNKKVLDCPVCGWHVRWRVYFSESEKADGQLHAGNAGEAFRRYITRYPQSTTREEKILAIDQLIHEFHWIMKAAGDEPVPHKPAAVNLLRGNTYQVLEMLNELTFGSNTSPDLAAARTWWEEQCLKSKIARPKP